MASMKIIAAELSKMAALYRQQMGGRELELLVRQWAELCVSVNDADFAAAMKKHKQRNDFFPKPANVLKIHEENLRAYQPTNAALPQAHESDFDRWLRLISGRVCQKAFRDKRFKGLADAYFATTPGMSEHRKSLAGKILGVEFVEFEAFQAGHIAPGSGWMGGKSRMTQKNALTGILRHDNCSGIVAYAKTTNRALEWQREALNDVLLTCSGVSETKRS